MSSSMLKGKEERETNYLLVASFTHQDKKNFISLITTIQTTWLLLVMSSVLAGGGRLYYYIISWPKIWKKYRERRLALFVRWSHNYSRVLPTITYHRERVVCSFIIQKSSSLLLLFQIYIPTTKYDDDNDDVVLRNGNRCSKTRITNRFRIYTGQELRVSSLLTSSYC